MTPYKPTNDSIFPGSRPLVSMTKSLLSVRWSRQEWSRMEYSKTFCQVDPQDIWLGPQLHLLAYDAAWTLTPKKRLLAA